MNIEEYAIRPYNPLTGENMGKALIINNNAYGGAMSRFGSMEDLKRVKRLKEYLNFKLTIKQDLESNDILREVKSFIDDVKAKGSACDMVSVVLMGHGTKESILGIDGVGVEYDDIFSLFNNENCRALIGKPKLFIIQVNLIISELSKALFQF